MTQDNNRTIQKQLLSTVENLLAAKDAIQSDLAYSDFVEQTSHLPIIRLEHWERAFRHHISLFKHRPDLFGFIRQPDRHSLFPIPWIECCSGDGYQREKVLRSLNEGAPNGFLLAIVLRKLNDWVPQVRTAARECIARIAPKTQPSYVITALWGILPYLHTWGRLQPRDAETLIDLLCLDNIPPHLIEKVITSTAGPAPFILGQTGRKSAFDLFLPRVAEEAIQPAVRAKAYKNLLAERTTWLEGYQWIWTDQRWCKGRNEPVLGQRKIVVKRPFIEILEKAATDKSPIVRRVAGDALLLRLNDVGVSGEAIAATLSQDASPSVAERGEFALKRIKLTGHDA